MILLKVFKIYMNFKLNCLNLHYFSFKTEYFCNYFKTEDSLMNTVKLAQKKFFNICFSKKIAEIYMNLQIFLKILNKFFFIIFCFKSKEKAFNDFSEMYSNFQKF